MRRPHLINHLLIAGLLLSIGMPVESNETSRHLFEQANQYYNQSEYAPALESYQKILEMGYESGPLYYNIGNCYYKLGEVPQAILYYERAKKFMPRDEDLKSNLAIVQLSAVDKIVPSPDFILVQAYQTFLTFLPKKTQLMIVILAYLLLMTSLIIVILTRHPGLRYAGKKMIWVFGTVFIVFLSAHLLRLVEEKNTVEAIIMADKVEVMSAPTESGGVELFGLHAGTKVRLDQATGDWVEIILPDRKTGWVKQSILEVI